LSTRRGGPPVDDSRRPGGSVDAADVVVSLPAGARPVPIAPPEPPSGDRDAPARARSTRRRTLARVPRTNPPRTTRHGHLHAVGNPPPLPVNAQRLDGPAPEPREPGLLGRLVQIPESADGAAPVVARRLDRGRLSAGKFVAAAGWDHGVALRARLAGPGRIRLQPETRALEASEYRAHVDAKGQIQLVLGLRTHLGIGEDGEVLARLLGDGVVEITNLAVVHAAFAALDTLAEIERRIDAAATAEADAV
jgi:hypothetical protein